MSVLGIVENMSGLSCPHCGEYIDLFKHGGGERAARELGVPFRGALPIDPAVVISGDAGAPAVLQFPESTTAKAFRSLAETVADVLESPAKAAAL